MKKLKKLWTMLTLICFLFTLVPTTVFADTTNTHAGDVVTMQIGSNTVYKNSKEMYSDVAPVIVDGRTLVPVRIIVEALGGEVDWNEASRTVGITMNSDRMELMIDQPIPGFGTGAIIMNDRTMVPVRYIMEYVGAEVVYKEDTREVIVLGAEKENEKINEKAEEKVTEYSKRKKKGSGNGSSNNINIPVDKEETPNIPVTGESVSESVTADADNKVATDVTMQGTNANATVSAGTQLEAGTDKLTLSISEVDENKSEANVQGDLSLDVHIDGIAADNTVPVIINLGKVLRPGQNFGNPKVYHVENGVTNAMVQVSTLAELDAHNEFYYDPVDGTVVVAMASFSEVVFYADKVNAWDGTAADGFAGGTGTEDDPYIIANANQLAYFAETVGSMNNQIRNSYEDDFVKLITDINLGDKEAENQEWIFYPIGYYYTDDKDENGTVGDYYSTVYSFEGTFDGGGHTISNFYQNTWEIKGDYDNNYYKDGMGLFGYVVGGTVKNLTVDHFSSDGEFTPTGVIAAYAENSTFENIAITNCNPRVYNTGNGGIIGIAGREDTAEDHIVLKNITVDNSNKISALWGSWDVACGGLVGMYRGNVDASGNATGDTIRFENCHVAAQIDVNNDVCANYQYYAYRYAGMIIGSIRHNTTNVEGKTIPNMAGIYASGCTVNYGDWNDYYYCEFVKNSIASYTHDYQFSRVPKSEIIFDEEGKIIGCTHDHEAAGTEIVNGEEVLKEDKTAVYLPFHQLFTGYSWGVSSVGLEEYSGIKVGDFDLDIEEGDKEESVEKFAVVLADDVTLEAGTPISVGTLFKALDGADINESAIQVAVTATNNSGIVGTYTADTSDWMKGTLTFDTLDGTCVVTIQDYNFCKPTAFILKDGKLFKTEKFESKFTEDFLYRVGNKNDVKLGSLFETKVLDEETNAIADIDKSNVTVSIEAVEDGMNVSGTFTANTSDWTETAIDFDGTGPVKLTIQDNTNYCIPTVLYLEVVDATNVTNQGEWKNNTTSVLLCNIDLTTTKYIAGNKVLYGNGFTIDATNAPYTGVQYDSESYVIYLENSKLDNVIIEGMVYPEVGGTKDTDYSRALVMTSGDCVISNCFLTNTASPVRSGGNLELKNTVLKGGAYANLDIRDGHIILDDVITINQYGEGIVTSEGKEVVGLGIVVYQEGGSEELKITIKNKLTQYNIVSEEQTEAFEGNAAMIAGSIFSKYDDTFEDYRFGYDGTTWVNTGIISMNNLFTESDLTDEREDTADYFKTAGDVTILYETRKVVVYSYKPVSGNIPSAIDPAAGEQDAIAPTAVFDFTNKNYIAKTEESNDYCYEDGGTVFISMDEGDTFNWDTSILTVTKNGQELEYTVTMNGTDYTGKSIPFDATGEYEVKFNYTDPYNYTKDDNYEADYEKTLKIQVAVIKASAKNAVFSFGTNGTAYDSKTVLIGDKTYVMPDVSATIEGEIGSTKVDGTTVYYPITEMYTSDGKTAHTGGWYACFPIFKNALQITDYADNGTGDPVIYNQSNVTETNQIPTKLKAVDPTTAFVYQMNASSYPPPTDPTAVSGAVCYTCNRNGLTASNTRTEFTINAEYTYTDNAGKVYYYYIGYHCPEQTNGGSCVTPDTLLTLADGSQKRVDQLTGDELLLVWNLETGAYDTAPIVFVDSDEERECHVIHLNFSGDSEVKVIYEHGFFDIDLGEYVYITEENYEDYIGHRFVKQADIDQNTWEVVTLTDAYIEAEETTAWSPVTAEHLCYYANGILSMPGGIKGLFNIFEVDTDIMAYDAEKMAQDIEEYGLFTYDDFEDLIPEIAYEVFNGDILKVAIGKGMLTWEEIEYLAERYIPMM